MLSILPSTLRKPPGRPTKVKRHKVGIHNQVVAPNQQETTPTHQQDVAPRGNLPFKRKPITV
ncbi:hypothetical protein CXB51_029299 [Gossypium anomalum]|uniref:Uncharacterized protein n=1 Tax=Gossypium anomalum TaxID=47600 RepID=A0A8J6CP42_9ROSI|nr:hypothetical protein CXB51_029299 [Gossypium anomalum]